MKTRDQWLAEVASAVVPWFAALGFPLPEIRISTGFPSSGTRGRQTAEAWREASGGPVTIFVRPDRKDAYKVAAALAHQMAQLAAGPRDEQRSAFRQIAISIGLRGRQSEATPGRLFRELIQPVLDKAGPLPAPYLGPTEGAQKLKQTARLIKVSCPECGYVVRVSRKWLDEVGPPLCPNHGQMTVAGSTE